MVDSLIRVCLRAEDAPLPSGDAEWLRLIALATEHGVAPLLWIRLKERDLPAAARAQLKAIYMKNTLRADALRAEQTRIVATFQEASIPLWTFKGPDLSESLFGDAAVRQVADIDLLIRPEDLTAADVLLARIGYARQARGELRLYANAQELLYMREAKHSHGGHGDTNNAEKRTAFAVDLHQRLLPYAERDPLAERIRAQGWTPENFLLSLCVNQITHRFSRLKYFLDVEAHLRLAGARVRWEEFLTAAQELDVAPGIFYSLDMVKRFAGAGVPEKVLDSLAPALREVTRMRRLLGRTLEEVVMRGPLRDGSAGARVALLCTRTGEARRRLLWRLLFPPESYLRQEQFAEPGAGVSSLQLRRLWRKLRSSKPAL
jgi:hypothetical protein